jgi:hypothetical protein
MTVKATSRAEILANLAKVRACLPPMPDNDSQPRREAGGSSPWTVRKDPRMARCLGCKGLGVVRAASSKDKRAMPAPFIRCPCGRLPDSTGQRLLAEQDAKRARLEELKRKGW